MPKIIGVDLDDVLMAFQEAFIVWHNTNYGTSYAKKDVSSYKLNRSMRCTTEEAVRRIREFFCSQEHLEALPVVGAFDGLRILGEENCCIITARPPATSVLTIAWLQQHSPEMVERIHFVGKETRYSHSKSTKAETCKTLGVEIFIDDAMVHARGLSAAGIPVLLFDNPWNQTDELPHNVERVYSWDEIVEKLK